MKILITGIHGFVGLNLVESLSAQNEIYGLGTTKKPLKLVEKIYLWEDLQHGGIPDMDVIIHLAGISQIDEKIPEDNYIQANTKLTELIYNYFRFSSAKKFIFMSSIKAVGEFSDEPITELSALNPQTNYGKSKLKAEEYILKNPSFGKKTVFILRPSIISGVKKTGGLFHLYSFIKKIGFWPFGAYIGKKTFTSISNLEFVIGCLLRQDIESGIYNVVDDDSISMNNIVKFISYSMKKPVRIFKIPQRYISTLALLGSYLHLSFNKKKIEKISLNLEVCNAKIKKAIGVKSMPFSTQEGISVAIRSIIKES